MNIIARRTTTLNGRVAAPSSKSESVRGILFALLAAGRSTLTSVLDSDDTQDAMRVANALGATLTRDGEQLIIDSPGLPLQPRDAHINSGNSGITTHFALPLLGFNANPRQAVTWDCGEQMRARPIHSLVKALRELGMQIEHLKQDKCFPITVSGTLEGGETEVDGLSSQYLSALLIALPCAEKDSIVRVKDLHERPYAELTLRWLDELGIRYRHQQQAGEDIFHVPGQQRYFAFEKAIAGDFSSASYLIAASALTEGNVTLTGLNMQDAQGDKQLIPLLQQMGADIRATNTDLTIQGGKLLQGIRIDANAIPDLLPTLAVIATQAQGKTEIYNVPQARIKETDRIHSMTQGLTRLGAQVEEHADGMTIYGSALQGAAVHGFGDHRTVMSLALAGMLATGATTIDNAEAIDKTFPHFVRLMQSLGADLTVQTS